MIIQSLLDTDLYKLTMLQPYLHSFPANHADYRFVCRNQPDYPLSELKEQVEAADRAPVHAPFHRGGARLSRNEAIPQERLHRLPAHLPAAAPLHFRHGPRRRAGHRGPRSADSCDAVRDLRARHRERALLPPLRDACRDGEGRARLAPRRSKCCVTFGRGHSPYASERQASVRVLRFRNAPPFLARVARGNGGDACARSAGVLQGHVQCLSRLEVRPRCHRHDGSRISADVPGCRRAAEKFPEGGAGALGAGVSRRSRHRTDRRRRHGRVPA